MDKYNCILLATDLTDPGIKVAEKCMKLVTHAKEKVHIVHALELFPTFSWGYGDLHIIEQQLEKEARQQLKKLSEKLGISSNQVHFKHENSQKAIVDLAKKLKCDLIVVGSHSKALFGSLGSTAVSVVNHAPCDVLIIRLDEQ
jgi:universal stress protein A